METEMKIKCFILAIILLLSLFCDPVFSMPAKLTIIHTNDLHSQLLGFSPNRDYSPMIINNDKTLGGWSRIAAVIRSEKEKRDHPVLVLDAGDFLMGSLFHMVSREEAFELVLMKEMGYDLTTLGNHEFDLRPEGLARIIESADRKGKLPQIVASNVVFNREDKRDDRLEEVFERGLVKPYVILEKSGIKIGFFGLVGIDAASVAPFASPVKFENPIETSKKMVDLLKNDEGVDLVICLSHSGLADDETKSEDEILAKEVGGIDIIISGHTHTRLQEPIVINDTIIVQAWEYGKEVGVLNLAVSDGKVKMESYRAVPIDDSIKGDPHIHAAVESAIETINRKVLQTYNLSFSQVVAETDFDLDIELRETNLGNLVTDATRWAVDRAESDAGIPESRARVSIQSNGVIRDEILVGETGMVTVSDLFRVVPLGIGWDGGMSYPLVSFYINASEIKKACEILTTVFPMKGSDYFLQYSGAKVTYNPNRMLFDRVTEIQLEDKNGVYRTLDTSDSNDKLYKVVSNIYNATFLKVIGGFTYGILTIVPKDSAGNPIDDLASVRVDGDRNQPGIQEIKDWTALISYVQSFEDQDGDGVPEIPDRYRDIDGRQIKAASLNPYRLLAGGSYVTWVTFLVLIPVIGLVALVIYLPVRIVKNRKRKRYK